MFAARAARANTTVTAAVARFATNSRGRKIVRDPRKARVRGRELASCELRGLEVEPRFAARLQVALYSLRQRAGLQVAGLLIPSCSRTTHSEA